MEEYQRTGRHTLKSSYWELINYFNLKIKIFLQIREVIFYYLTVIIYLHIVRGFLLWLRNFRKEIGQFWGANGMILVCYKTFE